MVRKVSPMSFKLVAAVTASAHGEAVNVSKVCRDACLSRKTFYEWRRRYLNEGLAGLEERSSRPHHSPTQIAVDVEDEIVRLRKELRDAGLDHGATTIQWHLGRDPDFADRVPSIAGVHRVLVRRGLVEPQPRKRPKSSWKRFEAAAPNERWQIDAMDWTIGTGVVRVFNIIDDHSRVLIASTAVTSASTEAAWATFSQAAALWGLPAGVLSDNGLAFSGKLRGHEVVFEANLRDAGVRPATGAPYHPQTTGKVERFQQTLKKWLRCHDLAADLTELQGQLCAFGEIYNHQRPHQGINKITPMTRWLASAAALPDPASLAHPNFTSDRTESTVDAKGVACGAGFQIHVGTEWRRQRATVIIDGNHASVLIDGNLVRYLELNLDRVYQPSGRPRGGKRQRPLPS